MKVQTTRVFELLQESDKRINVFQGSARASKTYNIILFFVIKLLQENYKVFSIVRKTLPALKGSVLRDLKDILLRLELFDIENWHMVDGYYQLGTNIIEFFSVDDETKLRGRRRDYLFINEATEINYEEYVQLALRTSGTIVIDLNPSLWKSWIYDLEGQADVSYNKITYKENPFLPQTVVDEIEKLKDKDPNLWRVFGLGERGIPTKVVFNHQQIYDELPADAKLLAYGCDFGFSDPNTLISVYKKDDELFVKELLYLKNTTVDDFIYKIKDLGINLTDDFICDSANPQYITQMSRAGINAKSVAKETILAGIDQIKRHKIFLHKNSLNLQDEFNSYVWKQDKNGNNVDEPEDRNNHLIDPLRYVISMKLLRSSKVYVYV